MRLIDADALIGYIEGAWEFDSVDGITATTVLRQTITDIRNQPTVDAVPVVHGRWIGKKLDDFRMWEVRCSECDWVGFSNYDAYDEPFDFNYCPNCGAKMDGDE